MAVHISGVRTVETPEYEMATIRWWYALSLASFGLTVHASGAVDERTHRPDQSVRPLC